MLSSRTQVEPPEICSRDAIVIDPGVLQPIARNCHLQRRHTVEEFLNSKTVN